MNQNTRLDSRKGTLVIPPSYLMFPSSPGVGLISPLTFRKKEEHIYTGVPSEVAISVASFFGDQGYLISF
ncbi:hypothetical protein MTR_0094s0040 [Medicago truncatula]|uniref:Uncharacterized protein n=1 Tax=Medicago truncatula TaxID=3880 RepID=A0A072TGU7_MEDTR|nr:hypothetical protein MTR_0094s0040 [Medicago truncatula]